MTLELIPVKSHTAVLAINVMPHLLLPFAFFWTGNHIWVLVISYQNHMHEVSDLEWERYAIAIARSRTRHIKNTCMVCCTPKTYGVLSHVFPIQSFSTFLIILSTITLSKCSVRLHSTFYLLFFSYKVTFVFSCTY